MHEKKARFKVIVIFLGIFILVISYRLFSISIQGIQKEKQSSNSPKAILRGVIFDRNGIALAVSQLVPSVSINPQKFLKDKAKIGQKINKLSTILGVSTNVIRQKVAKKHDKKFSWLERKISQEAKEEIKSAAMSGVDITEEYKRSYPHKRLASHVIGFAGRDDVGLEGLELTFNSKLKPESKKTESRYTFGDHIYLTIDYYLQKTTEEVLKGGVLQYGAEGGTVIILDSSNGKILSLANYPDYDNNEFKSFPYKVYKNLAITDHYEPGSIFKIFTVAMLLEEGLINENEKFDCQGKTVVSGETIKCTGKHGLLSIREVLKKSCNVGIVQASLRISKKLFFQYLYKLGFGKKTGINLVGENKGLIKKPKKVFPYSKSMMAFGYGNDFTPIQIIMAAASIANQGILYKPIIVDKIVDSNYKKYERSYPVEKGRIFSKSTTIRLQKLLKGVLESGGTAARAKVLGWEIAGKTGTVNIYNRKTRVYDSDKVNTLFVGFVPLPSKTLVFLIIIRKPTQSKISSHVTAPLFKALIEKILHKGLLYSDLS